MVAKCRTFRAVVVVVVVAALSGDSRRTTLMVIGLNCRSGYGRSHCDKITFGVDFQASKPNRANNRLFSSVFNVSSDS